ncbi:MAG TPA: hypothetical protein VMW55_03015 [Nitrosopumilaceae archaeon]|jgi:hypothetical protein|nr:hypothetical protein [Nitrosopumilaceae archaeon]
MENFLKEHAEFLGILLLYRFVIKAKPVKELKNYSSKNCIARII